MANKATDKEDSKLGSVQAPQEGDTDKQLDTPVSDQGAADAAEAPAPEDSDHQEDNNPDASKKPGEAKGRKTDEQVAAEQAPADVAPGVMDEDTNPVAQATGRESKDPYAEGKHIANPEPNNGLGEDAEKGRAKLDKQEAKDAEADRDKQADVLDERADEDAPK